MKGFAKVAFSVLIIVMLAFSSCASMFSVYGSGTDSAQKPMSGDAKDELRMRALQTKMVLAYR
jgi:hypothetical protein